MATASPPVPRLSRRGKSLIAALWIATAATGLALATAAHADTQYTFQSPSGNIVCIMWVPDTGAGGAACQNHRFTYAKPPPGQCDLGGWGSQIDLEQGALPEFECVSGVLALPPLPTLDYGQTHTVGVMTCASDTAGVTCTDTGTGHYFQMSHDSYQLG
jgi:hypothetical protein